MSRCVVYQSGGFTNYGISYRKYSQEELAEMENRAMTENEKAINIRAIKALEEVQQYRKHGVTLESALNNMCDLAAAENLIEEYRAIGTPEECRAAMEKQPVFNMDKVVEQLQKISDEAHDLIMVSDSPQYYDGYEDGVDKAIDIVKAGGVDGN